MISIYFNEHKIDVAPYQSLLSLLKEHEYDTSSIAVALNQKLVPSSAYESTLLQANDEIEVLLPMQGG